MSLTREEIVDLLTAISTYDGRKVDEATVAAWLAQSDIGRWTFDDALSAVHAHFASSETWLMPINVTTLVRQYRHDRMLAQDRALEAALPPPDPASQQRIRELVDQVAQRLSWPTDEGGHYDGPNDSPLAIRCTWEACHAPAGVQCRTPRGRPLTARRFHPGREDAWDELVKARQAR